MGLLVEDVPASWLENLNQ